MNLQVYKEKLDLEIKTFFALKERSPLREACEYSLNGGKRVRPLLVLLVAEALGKGFDVVEAALAVEFFHTASLIADDLPCMDNEEFRRGVPALHKVYGEGTALLASYTLIAAGYEMIGKNATQMKQKNEGSLSDKICTLALDSVSACSGIGGATQGQYLDLYPPDRSIETIYEVINKKTVTLFEIAFVLGFLFGGGLLAKLPIVKECSHHMGLAFQIADDLQDISQDRTKELQLNIALALGKEKALALFKDETKKLREKLTDLGLFTPHFENVIKALEASANSTEAFLLE